MWLGIETSSLVSSVALMDSDILLGELTVQAGLTHSEQLVPHIQLLLNQCAVKKQELDGIVVAIGPGSFTGLRIGMGTAKAMAYALKVPLYGVMTMDGLAENFQGTDRLVSVLIDAQKKNVYEARYRWNGSVMERIQEPMVKLATDIIDELSHSQTPTVFLVDGVKRVKKAIAAHNPQVNGQALFMLASPMQGIPRAGSLLWVARGKIEKGQTEDPMTMVPYYIRRSEAEVLWEEKHKDSVEALETQPAVTVIEAAGK